MRTAVLISAGAIIIVIALAIAGPRLIPAATYQKIVQESLVEGLDARVEMGEFRFRIIPYPGYTIHDLSIVSTKPPFQGMPVIQAKTINGSLSFPALLRGKIDTAVEMRDVAVDIRMASGISNLGMIMGIESAPSGAEAISVPPAAAPAASGAMPQGAEPKLESIPSMPAPAIEMKVEEGQQLQPGTAQAPAPLQPAMRAMPAPAPIVQQQTLPAIPAPTPVPAPTPSTIPAPPATTTTPEPAPALTQPTPPAPSIPGAVPATPPVPTPSPAPTVPGLLPPAPAKPEPAAPLGPPASELIKEFILRTALADQPGAAAAPVKEEKRLIIRSVEAVRGRITVTPEGDAPPVTIDNVSLAAKNISGEGGFIADVRITGAFGGARQPNISAEGRVEIDGARKEFTAKGLKLFINGAQLAADFAMNYGVAPASFDIHVATPDLNPAAFQPFLPFMGGRLPMGLSWQGVVATDISFKGTRDAGEIGVQIDAGSARISSGGMFSKEAGLPFKATATLLSKPEAFTISQCTLAFGDDNINMSGEILRDDVLTARLLAGGRGLKLTSIRSFFPWLASAGALEGVDADVSVEGPLNSDAPLAMEGKFTAAKAEVAGIALTEASAAFSREGEAMTFSALRGTYAGGTLSGNGSIAFGENLKLDFDAVVDGIEAAEIPTLHGALSGKASIVAKAASEGPDGVALAKNLVLSGSLVMPEGKISSFDGAGGVFAADTWKAIEELTHVAPEDATAKKLASASSDVADFKASFESKLDTLSSGEIDWHQPLYSAKLAASIAPSGKIDGSGIVKLSKDIAVQLIRDAAAQKLLLESDGELAIPVTAGGAITAPKLSSDKVKLASDVEQRSKAPEVVQPPAAAEEKPKATAPKETKPKETKPAEKPAAAKPAVPAKAAQPEKPAAPENKPAAVAPKKEDKPAAAPAPAPATKQGVKKAAPKQKNQDEEDILKVIIGK